MSEDMKDSGTEQPAAQGADTGPNTSPESAPNSGAAGTGSLLREQAEAPAPAAAPQSAHPDVPEAYTFSGAGIEGLDTKDLDAFSGFAKSAGLNQQQAQAVLDLGLAQNKDAQESMAKQEQQWRAQILADKDIGGDNIRATVDYARRALTHYGDDGEIKDLLDKSGYGSHPTILKFLYNVGKSVSEDTPPNAGISGKEELPLHERMYPSNK